MKINLTILFTLFLFSCSTRKSQTSDYADFPKNLAGRWENRTKDGLFVEEWKVESDSVLSGTGLFIAGNDTMFVERLAMITRPTGIFYETVVKGQNGDLPVSFRLTRQDENGFLFENTRHDFPQKIEYSYKGNDSLVAVVSGMVEGVERTEQFAMRKVSSPSTQQ